MLFCQLKSLYHEMQLVFAKLDLFVSLENALKFFKSLIRMRFRMKLVLKIKITNYLEHLYG